jgi:hypothetical protein
MNWQFRLAAAALLGFVMAVALGCDGGVSKVKVSGKLLMKGQPLIVSKKTIVTLSFAPEMQQALQTTPAKFVYDTGKYEIDLPVGKYRVSCLLKDTENNKKIPTGPPKVYDVNNSQTLDIDVTPE